MTSPAMAAVDGLQAEIRRLHERESLMIGGILLGQDATLLGTRCKITLEWPDGLPFGWTPEELRAYAETIFTGAGGVLDDRGPA